MTRERKERVRERVKEWENWGGGVCGLAGAACPKTLDFPLDTRAISGFLAPS